MVRRTLDEIDRRLLELVQHDASVTLSALGQSVGLSASAVQRRIRGYERAGLIAGHVAVVNADAVGDTARGLVLVELESGPAPARDRFREALLASPAVQQVYSVIGDFDYMLVLVARDARELRASQDALLKHSPIVKRVTTIRVDAVPKATLQVPIA